MARAPGVSARITPTGRSLNKSAARQQPRPTRADFKHFHALSTRWMDNDVYGHVNNVVHYSFFDTAVNRTLIEAGVLDIHEGQVIGLVVHTQCHYFDSITFPQTVHAGLCVEHLGNSSVRYGVGLFADDAPVAAAMGQFTHVYVDRTTRRPLVLPPALRAFLQTLQRPTP